MISQHIAGAAIGIFLIGGLIGVPLTDRQPAAEVLSMVILNPSVRPGDMLRTEIIVDRKRVCDTEVTRTIYDGANIEIRFLPDERQTFGPLGIDRRVVEVQVPASAKPGLARYRVTSTFRCNVLHRVWPITIAYDDIPFTIEAGESKLDGQP